MKMIPVGTSGCTAIDIALKAAREAGDLLIKRFNEIKEVTFKSRGNIVTDVDKEVEIVILKRIATEYPNFGLLGEESKGDRPDIGPVWIVDPLDGTRNYASGIPFFSVVIGLAVDGEPVIGVNYDPMRDEMFYSEKGNGAFLNKKKIHVSAKDSLADSIIGMDLSYNDEGAANGMNVLSTIWPGMQTARVMGSAALGISYVAAGRTDLYFHHQLEPWDQVAGLLLVEEAGGVITGRTGLRAGLLSDGLVAGNRTLHSEFMKTTEGLPWRQQTKNII